MATKKKTELLSQYLPQAVIDPDGIVVHCNPNWESLFSLIKPKIGALITLFSPDLQLPDPVHDFFNKTIFIKGVRFSVTFCQLASGKYLVQLNSIENKSNLYVKPIDQSLTKGIVAPHKGAQHATFQWDILTQQIVVSEQLYKFLGYEPGELDLSKNMSVDLIHPDDIYKLSLAFQNVAQYPEARFEVEYRMQSKNKKWLWLLTKGNVTERAEDGTPLKLNGIILDINDRVRMQMQLVESEKRFHTIFEKSPSGMFIIDIEKLLKLQSSSAIPLKPELSLLKHIRLTDINHMGLRIFDVDTRKDFLNKLPFLIKRTNVSEITLWLQRILDRNFNFDLEISTQNTKGKPISLAIKQSILGSHPKKPITLLVSAHDVTLRVKYEKELAESEERLRQIVENLPDIFWLADLINGNLLYVSPGLGKFFNGSEPFFNSYGDLLQWRVVPEDAAIVDKLLNGLSTNPNRRHSAEYRVKTPNGQLRWLSTLLFVMQDPHTRRQRVGGFSHNITTLKKTSQMLVQSLQEKELLLKEVHHRVKNNLQIVYSLLEMQGLKETHPNLKGYLTDNKNRIRSIALVHEKLYSSNDVSKIELESYLNSLVFELSAAQSVNDKIVNIMVDAYEIFVSIDVAIPCGLIVNELISNCYKHAFANTPNPAIWITLTTESKTKALLTVKDNGSGFSPDTKQNRSLGHNLIKRLSKQLGGAFVIQPNSNQGSTFVVSFLINLENKKA